VVRPPGKSILTLGGQRRRILLPAPRRLGLELEIFPDAPWLSRQESLRLKPTILATTAPTSMPRCAPSEQLVFTLAGRRIPSLEQQIEQEENLITFSSKKSQTYIYHKHYKKTF